MTTLVAIFSAVLIQSWRIGCLILAVAVLRWLVRDRVPQQVFFLSWVIAALALLVPISVSTAWSPFNLVHWLRPEVSTIGLPLSPDTLALPQTLAQEPPAAISPGVRSAAVPSALNLPMILAAIWLAGIGVFLGIYAAAQLRFSQKIRRSAPGASPRVTTAVTECAKMLRIRRLPAVMITDDASGPAIGGIWRPRLFVPASFEATLPDEELRLVLLHELGHWSRRDTISHFVIQASLLLHWFNPAAWLCARLARMDCELACDEFVMRRIGPAKSGTYGTTILKVLGLIHGPAPSSALLGIVGTKRQLQKRIHHIARYQSRGVPRILAGCFLVGLVAVVAATGQSDKKPNSSRSAEGPHVVLDAYSTDHASLSTAPSAEGGVAYTITVSVPNSVLHFSRFDIGRNDIVEIVQPSNSSVLVTDIGNLSRVAGTIKSNGKVYFLNTAGITVDSGTVINTAGFYASLDPLSEIQSLLSRGGAFDPATTFKTPPQLVVPGLKLQSLSPSGSPGPANALSSRTLPPNHTSADQLEKDWYAAEGRVTAFMQEYHLVSIDQSLDMLASSLREITTQLTDARLEMLRLKNLQMQIEEYKKAHKDFLQITYLSSTGNVPKLRAQLNQLEEERDSLAERYGDRHPAVVANAKQLLVSQHLLKVAIDQNIADLENRIELKESDINSLQSENDRILKEEVDLTALSGNLIVLKKKAEIAKEKYLRSLSEQAGLSPVVGGPNLAR